MTSPRPAPVPEAAPEPPGPAGQDSGCGQPAGPAIRIEGVTKRYGDREVLSGLSLDIPRGETFALLGPNGAGKSTTVGMLTGAVRPSEGAVRVLGENPIGAGRPWRARVGVVTQQSGDAGPFTPRELITHFGRMYPRAKPVDEVLRAVGLVEQAERRLAKLSGGQQRRLDVALGIVGAPEVLFLDEPTTGFDPEARHRFWAMIEGLKSAGTTILLTTHSLDEAEALADRAGVIAGGRLVAVDRLDRLGGAAARVPRVRWRDASGASREETTPEPARLVARLLAETGGEPAELAVIRPSLEDIYLGLIGRDRAGSAAAAAEVAA